MPKKDDIYEYNNEKFIFFNKYYEQNINGSLDVSVVMDKLSCNERYSFKEDFFNENFTKVEITKKEKKIVITSSLGYIQKTLPINELQNNLAGEYLCADLNYLKGVLNSFEKLQQVYVFIHISQQDWTRSGVACQEFMDLIASYKNVRATFHGHDHDLDGLMVYRDKPFLWAGHFGGSWGNPFPSYRVCEVGEDGKAVTYLKTIKEGMLLNQHPL